MDPAFGRRPQHVASLTMHEVAQLASAPRKRPEFWNISAKITRANQIANEELARAAEEGRARGDHNNEVDAMRHARWSRRMAQEIGPGFATTAGYLHELRNLSEGSPLSETVMDLHNNAVGIGAARRRTPIDPRKLQRSLAEAPSPPRRAYIQTP